MENYYKNRNHKNKPKPLDILYNLSFGQYVNASLVKDELDYEFSNELSSYDMERKGLEEDYDYKNRRLF